jgi:alpha-tubulin suppressor-like RCC1 family protein
VLIELLIGKKPQSVSCGGDHTLLLMRTGEVFSWGNNELGQCGTGNDPFHSMVHWNPRIVKFDDYFRPHIRHINAGLKHSAFVDDIGRLFMCGKGDSG